MDDNNPTTRCYPRTLREAFPKDDVATWFYPPERRWEMRDVLLALIGVVLWVWIVYYFVNN